MNWFYFSSPSTFYGLAGRLAPWFFILAAVLAYDLCFYAAHRLGHEVRLMPPAQEPNNGAATLPVRLSAGSEQSCTLEWRRSWRDLYSFH